MTNTTLPVFVHYLVGGMSSQSQAAQDIALAQSMGFDAFALNVGDCQSYTMTTLGFLFAAALAAGFQMFFSFDMTHFNSPSEYFELIQKFTTSDAYYKHNGLPFVSTFYGGTLTFGQISPNIGWDVAYKASLAALELEGKSIDTYFVPSFNDNLDIEPSQMYDTFGTPDGLFCWDSAWPEIADGKVNVSSTIDQQYRTAADKVKKTFMMSWSSLQFKHMAAGNTDNWYRRGELTITDRIAQILEVKPDFVEFISMNDGGESHYLGNLWPEAYTTTPQVTKYTEGFNHTAWGHELIKPAIAAFKSGASSLSEVLPLNGAKASGTFWYRTILTTATCASDPFLKPNGWNNAEDVVNVAVLLSKEAAGSLVKVYSEGKLLATYTGVEGLNSWSAPGLSPGAVKVDVTSPSGTTLVSGASSMDVQSDAQVCNYNYQVVGLA